MPHRPGTQVDLIRLDIMDVSPEAEYVIVRPPAPGKSIGFPGRRGVFPGKSACLGHFRPALNRRNPATPWNRRCRPWDPASGSAACGSAA